VSDPLAALRAEYVRDLPARVAIVAAAVQRAKEGGAPPREAATEAHRIRGTAGTLGLTEVSDAAGRIEDAIDAWGLRPDEPGSAPEPPVDHPAVAWAELDAALADLERAARALTPPAAPG
jgi:HPt (histidine-containing phosphotransfer) domain-containing protein